MLEKIFLSLISSMLNILSMLISVLLLKLSKWSQILVHQIFGFTHLVVILSLVGLIVLSTVIDLLLIKKMDLHLKFNTEVDQFLELLVKM